MTNQLKATFRTRVFFPTLPDDSVQGEGQTPEESLRDALDALGIVRDLSFQRKSLNGVLCGWTGLPGGLESELEAVN